MAGAGIKKFTVGEVLSDVEVNTYLMDQSVAVFANESTRDAAFGGAGEPTLSEGRLCYLQNRKVIQFYNGVSWSDSGQFTVGDNAISAAKLKSDVPGEEAVTTAKIRNDAVTADKLADSTSTDGDRAVTRNHIRDGAINSAKLASGLTFAGTTTISGTGKIQQILEKGSHSATALTGEQSINIENGAVYIYSSDSVANFSFKITSSPSLNSAMSQHDAVTLAFFCKQGNTAYKLNNIKVDELLSGVTVRWFGGSAYPSGNASSMDVYTVTIVKMGDNVFDVYASQSSFKE
jgi:hypothetical protein